MKAAVLTAHGDIDKIEYKDVKLPQVKNGEVLVKISATETGIK